MLSDNGVIADEYRVYIAERIKDYWDDLVDMRYDPTDAEQQKVIEWLVWHFDDEE